MNHPNGVDSLAIRLAGATEAAQGEVSRRAFVGLSLASAGALVFGCSDAHSPPALSNGATAEAPFGIWDQLRSAVRASPDHLGATADRLVAAKDAQAICEFVRDQIATYPPQGGADALTGMRWGVRGTLRGGAGTPREKAELLVSLYQRAGFDAHVVMGNATTSNADSGVAGDVYLRTIRRELAPAVDDATLSRWQSELSAIGQVPEPRPIDADDSQRNALVARILALLPSDAAASNGSYEATLATASLGIIPLVAVSVAGKVRYANPLLPDLAFGLSGTDETPTDAPPAQAAPSVVVELFISTTVDPLERISVARATYAAEDLAGRQILARFVPNTDLDTLAKLRIVDIHAFRPVLSVRGLDVDPDAQASFVTVGPTITTRGDVIDTLADGTVTIGGKPLFAQKDLDPNAAARVSALSFEVRAGAFPTVELAVEALDKAGNAVRGLPAAAFQVLEESQPLGFLESSTPSSKMRILLVLDLDDPLGSGEDPAAFAAALTTAVTLAYPDAVMVTGEPQMFVESTDPAAVALSATNSNATADADNPWQLLADAAREAPTITVIVSDFTDFSDPFDPTARSRKAFLDIVASGPPIVGIDTAPPPAIGNPVVDQVIALTGGAYVVGTGVAEGVQAVLDVLAKQKAGGTYTLRYSAPAAGPAQRNVSLSVGKKAATNSYAVPARDTAAQPTALAGLYLNVSLGDVTVTRVLGGYPSVNPPADGERLSPAVLDDVTSGLFGVTLLSFEAGAPTWSTLLDEQLSRKLSAKPLYQAVVAQDSKAISAALPTLAPYVPIELVRLHCALPENSSASATYENGLRVIAYSNRPRFGVGQERRIDILPLASWSSVAADAATSFQDTLARTARIAIVEGHTYGTNTLTALAGKKLRLLSEDHVDPSTLPYAPDVAASASELLARYEGSDGYYRLLPEGKTFPGFWAVERKTGALLGIMPDGSGGASASDPCSQLSDINNAFDALGLLAEMAEMGALGPFFLIGKEVAAVALLSAALLGDQDGTLNGKDPNAAINGLAANAGCEAMKLGVLNSLPGKVGSIINKADAIGSVAGATPNCPNALSGVGCK